MTRSSHEPNVPTVRVCRWVTDGPGLTILVTKRGTLTHLGAQEQ